MAIWLPDIEQRSGPRYLAIVRAISDDLASGSLSVGAQLPPQRDLAYALGVSPNTVMRAYAEAARRGYVEGTVGRGTFIRSPEALPAGGPAALERPSDGPIDFSLNLPFVGDADLALSKTLNAIARTDGLAAYLEHQDEKSRARHEAAGAAWIRRLGFDAADDRIVLTNGAQQGIFASLLALLRPGDVLLTEELTYAPVKSMARHLGATTVPVAIDDQGLLSASLEAACEERGARLLYCTPTLQTPTTATMSEERRRKIADVAEAQDLIIIEDDTFGFLPEARPRPLAAFAPERTVLVMSTSKCMAPGLRIGYVHAPERLKSMIQSAVSLSSWMPPPLMAEIATRWIEDGTAIRLSAAQRAQARKRQAMARAALADRRFKADPDGLHLWLCLPEHWRADAFAAAARRDGVLLRAAETFAARNTPEFNAVRLCLSHELSDARVTKGLDIVVRLLDRPGDDGLLFI